jgi:hypothetical protein
LEKNKETFRTKVCMEKQFMHDMEKLIICNIEGIYYPAFHYYDKMPEKKFILAYGFGVSSPRLSDLILLGFKCCCTSWQEHKVEKTDLLISQEEKMKRTKFHKPLPDIPAMT